MSEQETTADIIAEMSGQAGDDGYPLDIKHYVRRLEAAHRREASGNTAALHEALKPVKRYLDGYTVNILELRRTVDAALTAPARNCDRFASAEEACIARGSRRGEGEVDGETSPKDFRRVAGTGIPSPA